MAVIVPTIDEVLARFPDLEGNDELVEACLEEAQESVDDRWREADTKRAIMYLTAHLVQTELDRGAGSGSAGNIASESMGPMSVSYRDGNGSKDGTDYNTTIYGQRFYELLRANFGGVMIADAE